MSHEKTLIIFDGLIVGWFYVMATLAGLFYAEVSLNIMVSNYIYIWHKNLPSQSFYTGKYFVISNKST